MRATLKVISAPFGYSEPKNAFLGVAPNQPATITPNTQKIPESLLGPKPGLASCCLKKEWLDPESNRGHEDFQSSALPTELSSREALNPNDTPHW